MRNTLRSTSYGLPSSPPVFSLGSTYVSPTVIAADFTPAPTEFNHGRRSQTYAFLPLFPPFLYHLLLPTRLSLLGRSLGTDSLRPLSPAPFALGHSSIHPSRRHKLALNSAHPPCPFLRSRLSVGSSSASSPKVKEENEETIAPAAPSSSEAPVVPPTDAASAQSNPSSRSTSKEPGDRRPSFPKSKLTGEVNPFELSFSKPSPDFTTLASLQSNGDGTPGGRTTPGEPKPSLPSIGHITTPLAENEAFTWPLNTPAISSLRSGMEDDVDTDPMTKVANLPTPATSALIHHALSFDPSNFVRTGLTPGTGMTPLTGGPASFPPPSPNTAAFLAMVQNATAGATNQMGGVNGTPGEMPLMTPGTFNNVMSQLSQMQDGGGPNGQANGAGQQQQQPDYFSHRPDGAPTHIQQQLAQAGQPHRPGSTGPGPSGLHQVQYPHPAQQQQQQQMQPGRAAPEHYLQQSAQVASQAANGLYLLSQAHQEIAKREQDPNMPSQQIGYNGQRRTFPSLPSHFLLADYWATLTTGNMSPSSPCRPVRTPSDGPLPRPRPTAPSRSPSSPSWSSSSATCPAAAVRWRTKVQAEILRRRTRSCACGEEDDGCCC